MYIVSFEYRLRQSSKLRRQFIRAEYAPDNAANATRFETYNAAETAADIVRKNFQDMGRSVTFKFIEEK